MRSMKPVVLLSLPRSGSTLLQRMIASHRDVCTLSEPWILLPSLYALERTGILSEYNQESLRVAIEDFCGRLPNGENDYLEAVGEFALRLYTKTSVEKNAKYFMDKTPRYCLVAKYLRRVFPEGKFVVLFRNPLSVVSSRFASFGNRWRIYNYKVDLYKGLGELVEFYRKNREDVCAVRYEDLVADPEATCGRIFEYLEIGTDERASARFSDVELEGRMGDRTGRGEYRGVCAEPLEKWKLTLANPLRKFWCRRYIQWIGAERLAIMGYSKAEIIEGLDGIPNRASNMAADVVWGTYGLLDEIFEVGLLRRKLESLSSWREMRVHR